MRTFLLLIALTGCWSTSSPPADDPSAQVQADLDRAVAAWRAEPGPETLQAVSLAAEQALEVPPGDLAVDLRVSDALTQVLLRPDLARARLEPHAGTLQGEARDLWLDTLLRDGDLPALAEAVRAHQGVSLDPSHPALEAAALQASRSREVDWRDAVKAHEAATLADRQITYGRPTVDHPLGDLRHAFEVLPVLYPGWTLEAVTTRTAAPTDGDAATTVGAIPTRDGSRRVVAHAGPGEPLQPVADALMERRPPQVAGYVVRAIAPDGRDQVLCSEGRFEAEGFWMISGCTPTRAIALANAVDLWRTLGAQGVDDEARAERVRSTYGQAFQ